MPKPFFPDSAPPSLMGSPGAPFKPGRPGVVEFLVMAAFAILLTIRLDVWPLNADEARYARSVSYSWNGMFTWIVADNYPPGYFVLLKLWTGLAGLTPKALRLFSVPFGFFSLLVFGVWACDGFGPRIGRRAWVLLAVSPFFLLLCRMGKYYSIFIFLALAATSLLWWILERREGTGVLPVQAGNSPVGDRAESAGGAVSAAPGVWRLEALWIAASLGLVWIHYLGSVVWLAMGGWLLLRWARERSPAARRLFLILCVAFIGFLPWMPVVVPKVFGGEEVLALSSAQTGYAMPGMRAFIAKVAYSAYAFALGHTLEVGHLALAAVGCLAAGAAFCGGVIRTLHRRHGQQEGSESADASGKRGVADAAGTRGATDPAGNLETPDSPGRSQVQGMRNIPPARAVKREAAAARYCLFLLAVMGVASLFILGRFLSGLPVLAVSERVAFLLPYAILLALYGIDRWPRLLVGVLALCFLIPVAVSLRNLYTARENNTWDQKLPWDRIVQTVTEEDPPSAAVLFDNYHFGSLGWYYLRPVAGEFTEVFSKEGEPKKTVEQLVEGVSDARRVFYVRSTRDLSPEGRVSVLEEALAARYGPPCMSVRLAFDSLAMRKLKEWFRRGTDVETYPGKITIRVYCPGEVEPGVPL